MNATTLKNYGMITMTIDHIAVYLVSTKTMLYLMLRAVGRLSFPVFAFMVAEGLKHTKSKKRYALRLTLFAVLIELFLIVLFFVTKQNYTILWFLGEGEVVNVIWPLVFGMYALMLIKKHHYFIPFAMLIIYLAFLLNIPYGMYGILLIIVFGVFDKFEYRLFFATLLALGYAYLPLLVPFVDYFPLRQLQLISLFTVMLFYFYNGLRGKGSKWFFYIYYPLHIGILFLIQFIIR
jgi:hypothetical protein